MLQKGVKLSLYCKRSQNVISFFQMENELCYCCDIDGLFQFLEQEHDSNEWHLFIDTSKTSVKVVLLYIAISYHQCLLHIQLSCGKPTKSLKI